VINRPGFDRRLEKMPLAFSTFQSISDGAGVAKLGRLPILSERVRFRPKKLNLRLSNSPCAQWWTLIQGE
jgi:hypothetical protein